jgi:hypothetical protein
MLHLETHHGRRPQPERHREQITIAEDLLDGLAALLGLVSSLAVLALFVYLFWLTMGR